MKYKVGDEVLVKAKIVAGKTIVNTINCYRASIGSSYFDISEGSIIPIPDMTAEEAWEIMKRLFLNKCDGIENAFSDKELEDIFGTRDLAEIVNNNTPNQIKAKIEVWEAEKEIKVGDEVAHKRFPNDDRCKFFITEIDNKCRRISGFSGFSGEVFSGRDIDMYQKTGRHIDIEGMLNQIGDDER